jgi:hypothetical protein
LNPYAKGTDKFCFRLNQAGVAQSVEQLIRNQQVGGSNPPAGSIKNKDLGNFAQVLFCYILKKNTKRTPFLNPSNKKAAPDFCNSLDTVHKLSRFHRRWFSARRLPLFPLCS